jgi:hypothetical protein
MRHRLIKEIEDDLLAVFPYIILFSVIIILFRVFASIDFIESVSVVALGVYVFLHSAFCLGVLRQRGKLKKREVRVFFRESFNKEKFQQFFLSNKIASVGIGISLVLATFSIKYSLAVAAISLGLMLKNRHALHILVTFGLFALVIAVLAFSNGFKFEVLLYIILPAMLSLAILDI